MSPDGFWVVIYSIQYPNTSTVPQVTNPDLPMAVDVFKSGSDATNLAITTAGWAAGLTVSDIQLDDTVTDASLAPLTRSVIAGKNPISGLYGNVNITPEDALTVGFVGTDNVNAQTWDQNTAQNTALNFVTNTFSFATIGVELVGSDVGSGVVTFEASIDSLNWIGLTGVNAVTSTVMSSAAYILPLGDSVSVLLFNITGFNYFRGRLSSVLTSAGSPPAEPSLIISYSRQGQSSNVSTTTVNVGSITLGAVNQGTAAAASGAWPVYETDGSGHSLTTNSTTTAGKFARDFNLISILGTAPSTAGKLDVICTNAGTFAVQEATLDGCISANKVAVSLASTTITGTVAVTQSTSPWVVGGTVGVNNLPSLSSTNYGSPPVESLNVYVTNPLTVTFTESTIGVTKSTSPWVVSNGARSPCRIPRRRPSSASCSDG